MIQLDHISIVKYSNILRKSVSVYQKQIDEILSDTPICGLLVGAIEMDRDDVECQFWLTSDGEPTHICSFYGKLVGHTGDFKTDVNASLSPHLERAKHLKNMWNSESLNEYLIHPTEWMRVAAKAIYLAKQTALRAP